MSEDFSCDFRYHGLSAAQLAEIIYAQKLQGYDGIIEENARLRMENARLQQRCPVDATTMGQVIQGILDQGFCVAYGFDRREGYGGMALVHRFTIWKYHGEEKIMAQFMVSDVELKHAMVLCLPRLELLMKEINTQLIQRRLIEEALP